MKEIWLSHYPAGVPAQINPQQYHSLVDLLEKSCAKHAHLTAYTNMGSTLSYAEVNTLSLAFAVYLQTLGLERGARIALMMPNVLQYPVALFAILRAGYVVVNTNPLYTPSEFIHQMNDAGAEAIIVLDNFAHIVAESLVQLPALKHVIVTKIGDLFPPIKRHMVNFVVKYIKHIIPSYHLDHAIPFLQALKQGQHGRLNPISCQGDDIAFLQYTGGTTGVAKGAMLTHTNMVANVLQATHWLTPLKIGSDDIIVTALPLYHIFSLTANCLVFFAAGAKNILITNPRDMSEFIRQIKNTGFTSITGVNTLFRAMLNHPQFQSIDFSRLKLALSGGMALQKNIALQWHERTKAPILEAYGLTETSPAVTINPVNLTEYNGSIGLPLPSTEISIRNAQGEELAQGEAGELCIRGPQVMRGYWHAPAETDNVFWPDGFLRTGDQVTMDENGFIFIVDRLKDLILVSGFNVYPTEIEHVISQIPGVVEVGVIGVNPKGTGEVVKACVVSSNPDLTAEDIIQYARARLTAYKVPKIVEFYTELPKSNIGKILRRALK